MCRSPALGLECFHSFNTPTLTYQLINIYNPVKLEFLKWWHFFDFINRNRLESMFWSFYPKGNKDMENVWTECLEILYIYLSLIIHLDVVSL